MEKSAKFSKCKEYRYYLNRSWNDTKKKCLFIMLNPSTADHTSDDPTIRRCIGYAKTWGYGSMDVVNLFSYRTPYRSQLKKTKDPIGKDTDEYILKQAKTTDKIVCAWGTDGNFIGRSKYVINMLKENGFDIHYIKLTKKGEPSHPLYLQKNLKPTPF